jgi:hypothetical protein
MSHRFTLTLDAADPKALGTFWATALGYVEEPPPKPYATWQETFEGWNLPSERWNDAYAVVDPAGIGPRFFLQKVPEAKTAKNRLHLDVWVPGETRENPASPGDKRAHAAHLVEHGATILHEMDQAGLGFWVVMADPEGNEFCVV